MEEREGLLAAARSFAVKSGEDKVAAGQRLQQLVLKITPEAVRATVRALRDDPAEYVRAVLVAARPGLAAAPLAAQDASGLLARRLAAYKASLALLAVDQQERGGSGSGDDMDGRGRGLEEKAAATLVSVLEAELGGITSAPDLTEVTEKAMEAFEGGSPLGCVALELLPKALTLLQMAGGGEADQVGSSACTGIINRVCQYSWPLGSIGKVLAVLRDFPLSQEGLARVVAQAGQRARLADVQDLPAIVHQLLMLSTRGCREAVLTEIMRLFDHKEASTEEPNQRRQLLEVQGLALLHMDMAVKHDAELGVAWLRQLRSDAPPRLSAFGLAISFMLAGIQRFEQPVTDAIKSLILGAYQDAASLAGAPWLPQPSSSSGGVTLLGAAQAAALRSALLQCTRNSGHNQAGIAQAIAQLASSLIEAGSGGGAGFGAGKAGNAGSVAAAAAAAAAALSGHDDPGAEAGDSDATPGQRAAALGTCLLLELFDHAGRDVRREVVALCHSRLIGAKEEVAAPYVRLLALIVRRNQATISDYFKEMQLSLEHVAFLPPNAAIALLLAVWPMCRSRRDAQDYVVMLLRKAMFSRELHARLLAARGFLYMITQELQSGSAGAALEASEPGPSQLSMSQLGSLTGRAGGATLLHEVMSFLRRCLTQQPDVRRAVYEGMPALLAADPSVQDSVAGPLLPHFLQFYEADENLSPPLKLEACARIQGEGVRLVEPLQHLLAGVRRVLCAAGAGGAAADDEGGATAALRSRFAALRRRLAEGCLEDFQMDGSVDFVPTTPGGLLSHAHADVLLGCLEVAMEDLVEEMTGGAAAGAGAATQDDDGPDVEALSEALAHLFAQHQRLVDLVTDRSKPGKAKKDGQGLTQATASTRRGPGRPPGGTAAPSAGGAGAACGVVTVDNRVPVFSLGCLAKMLDAIADDGFKLPEMDLGTMAPDMKLCREPAFVASVLTAAQRALGACEASDLTAAVATGTAGSAEDGAAVRRLFAVPEWQQLVKPLFRAAQTVILSHCKGRVAAAGAAAGPKKEKDLTEAMTQVAARALHQVLAMGAAGGAAGLAAVLELAPAPSAHAADEAALPPVEGLSPAQSTVAQRLPLLHELFCAARKPSCAKELEQLCACLALAAGALPPPLAGIIADWAVGACEGLSGLTQPAAARAVLSLALRGQAAVAGAAGARGAGGGGGRREAASTAAAAGSEGVNGDDLDLLKEVAADIKSYYDLDETPDEGERFAMLNARTHLGILAVVGQHLDSVQSSLEWALGKGKALAAAARGCEGAASAQQRAENQRRAWERATLTRLHKAAEVLALLAEARLQGTPCEALVRSLTRLYRLLGLAAKAQAPPKGRKKDAPPVSAAFTDLALWANKSLTPHMYRFIDEVFGQHPDEGEENEDGNEDEESDKKAKKRARANAAAASKAKRESKQVPNLIFQIEEFERHLIRLSAGGPNNLMVTARRATNRDFKIKLPSAAGEGSEAGGEGRSKRQRRQEAAATAEQEEEEAQGEGEDTEGQQEEEVEEGYGEEGEEMDTREEEEY